MSNPPIEVGSPYYELIRPIRPSAKLGLLVEILVTYGRVRWLLWRGDLPSVVAALRGNEESTTDRRRQAVGTRLGRAVARTLALLPFDSRCLVRSLVLTRLLASRGIESVLVIGVRVDPAFSAHAWVESGGRALLEPLDRASRLVEI
jgi:hypothetical protein